MRLNFIIVVFSSVFLVGILACKRELPHPPVVVDMAINLLIMDNQEQNLLDSTTSNYYKASEIRIFNLVNGVKTEVLNPAMDAPRNFLIYKNEGNGEYFMRLFPYDGEGETYGEGTREEIATTYIQWRENKVDTLDCTITRIWSSVYCNKVMYNSVIKYDNKTDKDVSWGDGIFHRFIQVKE
jgi:hypothetical protein